MRLHSHKQAVKHGVRETKRMQKSCSSFIIVIVILTTGNSFSPEVTLSFLIHVLFDVTSHTAGKLGLLH